MDNSATLQIPASLTFLQPTLDFAAGYAAVSGISGRALDEIRLGLEEAIVNVLEHGYGCDEGQTFDLECGTDGSSLIFVILEKGLPFDPEVMAREGNTADPTKGVGLRMMKTFMDEVTFSCLGMEGKEIRLVTRALSAVPLFEDLGFFFAGVMAGPEGRDRLVLPYLNNLRIAYASFRMASEEDRDLLAYVRQCAGDGV